MRCPACGATNPEKAQWCGQCLTRFGEPAPVAVPSNGAPPPSTTPTAPAAPAPPGATAEGFRREGDNLQWRCPSCEQFNDIEDLHCVVCGTAFTERFRAPEEPEPPRKWTSALALSALAPGAGHMAVGRYGSGVARLILFVTWMAGALLLGAGGGGRAMLAVAPLLLGAAVVWAGTLLDVQRLRDGLDEVLVGRRLLLLVIAVLVLLGVGLLTSAVRLLP